MTLFSFTHIIFLLVTIVFILSTMYLITKLNRKWQNIMFIFAVIMCSGGIFFRYAMGLGFNKINIETLLIQMLQVCNFNFILVPLMLIKKNEIARQYSFMFSMFAASTTLFALSKDWANLNWYDINIINSWLNHTFAIALPLWMFSARLLKPKKEYILKITIMVIIYFILSFVIQELLKATSDIYSSLNLSFIYGDKSIFVFEYLYKTIKLPCFYLIPLIPFMILFFIGLTKIFKNYKLREVDN